MGQQQANLDRVRGRIAGFILTFMAKPTGTQFFGEDLRAFVWAQARIAPGSADRILRYLKKKGMVNYRVVDRPRSLYEII